MSPRIKLSVLTVSLLVLLLAPARAPAAITLQAVGNFNQPLFVSSPPGDPRLFVVERSGTIQVLHDGTRSQFLDISSRVRNTGEQGLLSMAFDPNYATNGLFYLFYNGSSAEPNVGDIHIDEFHVSGDANVADPNTRRSVMTIVRVGAATNHNGGQLQFGPDGYLYATVGDDANSANAQTLANPHGKLLRFDPHGAGPEGRRIPPDNPFFNSPTPEIWSLGLRNPFRFSFDRQNGDLVIADVGASAFEEIDLAPASSGRGKGVNFGWPICEGFTGSGCGSTYVNPVFAYPHADPGGDQAYGSAIIGGYVYRGTQAPELSGRYVYVDLTVGEIRSIQLGLPLASGDRAETEPHALNTPTSFAEDSSCQLYVTSGNVVDRLVGAAPNATPACPKAAQTQCKKKKHKHKKKRAAESKKKKKHKKKRCGKKKKGKKKRGKKHS